MFQLSSKKGRFSIKTLFIIKKGSFGQVLILLANFFSFYFSILEPASKWKMLSWQRLLVVGTIQRQQILSVRLGKLKLYLLLASRFIAQN